MISNTLTALLQAYSQAPKSRAWTKEADSAIVELVAKYGPKHWSLIATHVPGRSGKQCRERCRISSCLSACIIHVLAVGSII